MAGRAPVAEGISKTKSQGVNSGVGGQTVCALAADASAKIR